MERFDIVVVGAGPGGYEAALEAARLGKKVAVIERKAVGGTCLNVGCIPSKSYLKNASWITDLKEAQKFGITTKLESIDFAALVKRKDQVVNSLQTGIKSLFKMQQVTLIQGEARFNADQSIQVGAQTIQTDKVILATGSKPFVPPIKGLVEGAYLTTDTFFEMRALPERLVIIGGGVIAIELAFAMAPLGVAVTVVEVASDILLTEDQLARELIKKELANLGVVLYLGADIIEVKPGCLHLSNQKIAFDKLLVATGRICDLSSLAPLNLTTSEDGKKLKVNDHYQTSNPTIYAIGDLIEGYMLAHVATKEGIKAARHLAGISEDKVQSQLVPRCVYTTPEIASFGLSESEAKDNGYEVLVGSVNFNTNGKAIAANESTGFVKIIADKKYHEILGAVIVGAHATEMIHSLLAMKVAEGRLEEVSQMIFAHPTLTETVQVCAEQILHQIN